MAFNFATEEDVRRVIRSVLATERRPLPPVRPTQHLYSPLGERLPTVPCINRSGFVIPAKGLVKKSGVESDVVACVRPDNQWGVYLVNAGGDVPINGSFRAYAGGQVEVLTAGSSSGSAEVGPTPNAFTAQPGVPLIHLMAPPTTGQMLGWFDPPRELFGKPTASIGSGGSGDLVIYTNGRAATSPQLTVRLSWVGVALNSTKFATALYNAGAWYGAPYEC